MNGIGRGGGRVLSGELAQVLAGHWGVAEDQFRETAHQVFRELRNQRHLMGTHIHRLKETFEALITRPDYMQTTLTAFCLFSVHDTNQDLRFDDRARKELLLRVEECRDRLWEEIEERRALAEEKLKEIKEDGWVERQVGMVNNHFMVLMQAELERHHAGVSLLVDYQHCLEQERRGFTELVLVTL
ncbi:unnamed protein product, partial [Discosporangium mesarthrocarpum]